MSGGPGFVARCAAVIALAPLVGCIGSIDAEQMGRGPGEPPGASPSAAPAPAPPSPGQPGAAPPPTTPPPPGSTPPPGATPAPGAVVPGPMPLRRLTRFEYLNTVRDLLRLDAAPAIDLPADVRGAHGFAAAGAVGEVDVSRLHDAADALATLAVKDLARLLPCDPAKSGESACARSFVEKFGRRAFRRALTDGEIADLVALYEAARKDLGFDFAGGIGQVVRGMLQAPQLVYRWELGPRPARSAGGVVLLAPDELASRLSYFLWSSMPDDALFTAADGGRLSSGEDVAREARRMLADARAKAMLATFHRQWLHLRDELPNDLARAMDGETMRFVEALFAGDGRLETLLLSPVSYVNKSLAAIYELTGVTSTDLTERMLDPARRFGVFTHAAFLNNTADGAQSHPVRRGAVLYEQLLCGVLPPQPADVPAPMPPRPGLSNRERFAEHSQNACAQGCHGLIDPLGFAFEHYDGMGKYRTEDGGKPIDASGTLQVDGKARTFTSAKDLMPVLATSDAVRSCLATQWARFALGRLEAPGELGGMDAARAAFAAARYDLRALIVALTQTPSFLNRSAAPGEVVTR